MVTKSSQKKKIIDVAMLGARMHYAVPRILHEAGLLGHFYTDSYMGNKPVLENLLSHLPDSLKPKGLHRLLGRNDGHIPPEKVVSFDLFGLRYYWCKGNARGQEVFEVFAKTAEAFGRRVIDRLEPGTGAIFGFNTASKELFEYARSEGIGCILEQTSAPQRIEKQLVKEEFERWPDWQPGLETESMNNPLEERERSEWQLADMIIGGSQFVADGLENSSVPAGKCKVVPYGVSLDKFTPEIKDNLSGRPLRVMFVGKVCIQKGVQYLLEAIRLLGTRHIEVSVVGQVAISDSIVSRYKDLVHFRGTVPRKHMLEMYKWADVLVFPSICEGSAAVTYEALASGVPVITTLNSGSLVNDGIDGHIVPIRDHEAIARYLEGYIRSPELLICEQQAAVTGRLRVGVDAYRDRLLSAICYFHSFKK